MAVRTLSLVRHGQQQTEDPKDRLGSGLTPLGVLQAEAAAERLGSMHIDAIYASTLRRAAETAATIAEAMPGVPLVGNELLWECFPVVPAGLPDGFSQLILDQVDDDRARADRAYKQYFRHPNGHDTHELIVCHGNIIRYFVCKVLGVAPEAWASMMLHNCGITTVSIESDGRFFLVSHNDVGHMSPEIRTLR